MNDKEICEKTWKLLEHVKTLSDDPVIQCLLCLNVNSYIQNEVSTEAIRQLIDNLVNPK